MNIKYLKAYIRRMGGNPDDYDTQVAVAKTLIAKELKIIELEKHLKVINKQPEVWLTKKVIERSQKGKVRTEMIKLAFIFFVCVLVVWSIIAVVAIAGGH